MMHIHFCVVSLSCTKCSQKYFHLLEYEIGERLMLHGMMIGYVFTINVSVQTLTCVNF